MIVFDTTVLVYAVGSDHALRQPCRGAVGLARDGSVRATTTVEVVQEFLHVRRVVRAAPKPPLGRDYACGLGPLARPEEDDLFDGLSLFASSEGLGAFDAVLAACARRRNWALASADRAFATVSGLTHLDPALPSFLSDLAAFDR